MSENVRNVPVPTSTTPGVGLYITRRDYEVGLVASRTEALYADPGQLNIGIGFDSNFVGLDLDGVQGIIRPSPVPRDSVLLENKPWGSGCAFRTTDPEQQNFFEALEMMFQAFYTVKTKRGLHVVAQLRSGVSIETFLGAAVGNPLVDKTHLKCSVDRRTWLLRVSRSWKPERLLGEGWGGDTLDDDLRVTMYHCGKYNTTPELEAVWNYHRELIDSLHEAAVVFPLGPTDAANPIPSEHSPSFVATPEQPLY